MALQFKEAHKCWSPGLCICRQVLTNVMDDHNLLFIRQRLAWTSVEDGTATVREQHNLLTYAGRGDIWYIVSVFLLQRLIKKASVRLQSINVLYMWLSVYLVV